MLRIVALGTEARSGASQRPLRGALQLLALFGAFWAAVLSYRGDRPVRFVGGLALGAFFAHLGWALLHWPVPGGARGLLDPTGFTVLFLPLGLVLLAPGAAAWRALPRALAVARAGCMAGGCCGGIAAPWGGLHPTPLYEIASLLLLHLGLRRLPDRWVGPAFLAGFGLLRLLVEPWRAPPALGEPWIAAAWIAGCWVAVGLVWGARRLLVTAAGSARGGVLLDVS